MLLIQFEQHPVSSVVQSACQFCLTAPFSLFLPSRVQVLLLSFSLLISSNLRPEPYSLMGRQEYTQSVGTQSCTHTHTLYRNARCNTLPFLFLLLQRWRLARCSGWVKCEIPPRILSPPSPEVFRTTFRRSSDPGPSPQQ